MSGVDVQLNYRLDLPPGFGDLAFEMNGSYLQHDESTPYVGAHTYDCAGLFGFTCQTINPRWHHIFRSTWQTPWGRLRIRHLALYRRGLARQQHQ